MGVTAFHGVLGLLYVTPGGEQGAVFPHAFILQPPAPPLLLTQRDTQQ